MAKKGPTDAASIAEENKRRSFTKIVVRDGVRYVHVLTRRERFGRWR